MKLLHALRTGHRTFSDHPGDLYKNFKKLNFHKSSISFLRLPSMDLKTLYGPQFGFVEPTPVPKIQLFLSNSTYQVRRCYSWSINLLTF